jgi:hypothetical protein
MIKISTRLVVMGKSKVLKIPVDYRGYLQGKNEGKLWEEYKYKNILQPVIWECFGIVLQKRAEPVESISTSNVKKIKSIIKQLDINNCDLHNPENWGMYKGKLLLLDYGIDEKISKMY